MEFIKKNIINTTTQIVVNSNTGTAENIFRKSKLFQYVSSGFSDDATTSSITINFDSTTTVSRISVLESNWKDFTIFYNGSTASTFGLTSTASTSTSDFSSNSEKSFYLECNSVDCTSVTFDITGTQVADQEKAVGFITLADTHFKFGRDPSAKNYKPKLNPKRVEHKMSDGGLRIHALEDKWEASIKFKFIDTDFRNNLKDLYDLHVSFNFVPFGTSASWDGIIFESVWSGPFDFFTYSDNAAAAGFSGTINIKETSI